jgi:hypothetical protein
MVDGGVGKSGRVRRGGVKGEVLHLTVHTRAILPASIPRARAPLQRRSSIPLLLHPYTVPSTHAPPCAHPPRHRVSAHLNAGTQRRLARAANDSGGMALGAARRARH